MRRLAALGRGLRSRPASIDATGVSVARRSLAPPPVLQPATSRIAAFVIILFGLLQSNPGYSLVLDENESGWAAGSVTVATGPSHKGQLTSDSDGEGGVFLTWTDDCTGVPHVVVQHIDSLGIGRWSGGGVVLAQTATGQAEPHVMADGEGGAIVVWEEVRSGLPGGTDLYAQRLDVNGTPHWGPTGAEVCTVFGDDYWPQPVSDGAGGVIVAWMGGRGGAGNFVLAQHLNASGVAQWQAGGVVVGSSASWQYVEPQAVTDGAGGAIVAWRSDNGPSIEARRVRYDGALPWGSYVAGGNVVNPLIAGDGSGGAFVAWQWYTGANWRIAMNRIDFSGAPQALWGSPVDVINEAWDSVVPVAALGNGAYEQLDALAGDGSGGVLVTWQRSETGSGAPWDVYAQRMSASGQRQWGTQGVAVASGGGDQANCQVVADRSGGALVSWTDDAQGRRFLARRLDSVGTLSGIAVVGRLPTTSSRVAMVPTVTRSGAILAWPSNSTQAGTDILAARLDANLAGTLSFIVESSAGAGGTIVPRGASSVPQYSTADFALRPNQGFSIQSVSVDGIVGTAVPHLVSVEASHTVAASFAFTGPLSDSAWIQGGRVLAPAPGAGRVMAANDGFGGSFVVWTAANGPGGVSVAHIQHLDAAGVPRWSAGGVVVGQTTTGHGNPHVMADGEGGAIVVWEEVRSGLPGGTDLYAQRLDVNGAPHWGSSGAEVCTVFGDDYWPQPVSDGAGGVIVAWMGGRGGAGNFVLAQHLSANGVAQWQAGGVVVGSSASWQYVEPQAVTDGAGGAIVAWYSDANNPHQILARRVRYDGATPWAVSDAANANVANPLLAADGSGGAFVAWQWYTGANWQISVNRIDFGGAPQKLWGGGVAVINEAWDSVVPVAALGNGTYEQLDALAGDGSGGVLVTWQRSETGSGAPWDAYAQRVNASGQRQWGTQGVAVASGGGDQANCQVVADGSGGALISWTDSQAPANVKTRHLSAAGVPDAPAALFVQGNAAVPPAMVPDGAGGAVVAWFDHRSGAPQVFAQHVGSPGVGFDYTISSTVVGSGSVSPPGNVGVWAHSTHAVVFAPASGQRVAEVTIDGTAMGTPTSWTFDDVSGTHAVAVRFAPQDDAPASSWYPVSSHGFDDLNRQCQDRGWTGADLSGRVYAHVSSRFVVNGGGVAMGTRAVWCGADSVSAPAEVRDWVQPYGFGDGWSQRLVSPAFAFSAHPGAVLAFDAWLGFGPGAVADGDRAGDRLLVQGLRSDGAWTPLVTRWTVVGAGTFTDTSATGGGVVRAEVHLDADGNASTGLAAVTRVRAVVETDSSVSMADGQIGAGPGAAVIDNATVRDGLLDLVPGMNCEGGTTGAWTLSAANAAPRAPPGVVTTDQAPPGTAVALRAGIDAQNASCAWTFFGAGDSVRAGTAARLTSPWIALPARDSSFVVTVSGRFPTYDQHRFVTARLRGKRAGAVHPLFESRLIERLTSATVGSDDASTPVVQRALRFPQDFIRPGAGVDSVQMVWEVGESWPGGVPSQLPFLDDLRLHTIGTDSDGDGIADIADACPLVSASGEDADRDGCVDATWTLRHVETWPLASRPIHFRISSQADPRIVDGSDLEAVRAGFAAWSATAGANVTVVEDSLTGQTIASPFDGVNLVTFADDFGFPPNVIAITPTLSFTRRAAYDDRMVNPGEIVDADLILNPDMIYSTPTTGPLPDGFDLRSVVTHEAGHFLGLSHSGVLGATMFPVLQPGVEAASLSEDDAAALASAYPGASFASAYGAITGTVHGGLAQAPVGGALVYAVRVDGGDAPVDTVSSDYTREDGRYALRRLVAGRYAVRVQPLDGSVPGLLPGAINARVAVMPTAFVAEWWDAAESASDDPAARTGMNVTAGQTITGRDVTTNIDIQGPQVVRASPGSDTTQVSIETALLVEFSEPLADTTLGTAFKLRVEGQGGTLGGHGQLLDPGTLFVFVPSSPLAYDTRYELVVDTTVTDRSGVPLVSRFHTAFRTQPRPGLAVSRVLPAIAAPGALVLVLGSGFDSTAHVMCPTSAGAQLLEPVRVTSTEAVLRMPPNVVSGALRVVVGADTSNGAALVVPGPGSVTPVASGGPIVMQFAPSGLALSADGAVAVTAGEGGLVTVRTTNGVAVPRAVGACARVVAVSGTRRVLASQPDLGRVIEVDADPASGTYGEVVNTYAVGGEPLALALSANERRLYVTDRSTGRIAELDVDPQSITRGRLLRTMVVAGTIPSGAITADLSGASLVVATTTRGVVRLDLASGQEIGTLGDTPAGALAVTPDNGQTLVGTTGAVELVRGETLTRVATSGAVRGIAPRISGDVAFVVLGTTSRLVAVDLDSTRQARVMTDQGTGASPVAVAISADGSVLAVASTGDRALRLYGFGQSGGTLARVVPGVATPGEHVAVSGSGSVYGPGSVAQIADSTVALTSIAAGLGAAIRLPALGQGVATVSLATVSGDRTGSLPIAVVSPQQVNLRATGVRVVPAPFTCGPSTGYLAPLALEVSPDDRRLAMLSAPSGLCAPDSQAVTLFTATEEQSALGTPLVRAALPITSAAALTWDLDGRELWVPHEGGEGNLALRVLDADPGSPGFGTVARTLSVDSVGHASQVRFDPLGRWVWVLARPEARLTRLTPAGIVMDTLDLTGHVPRSLAVTRAGDRVLVATSERLLVIDAVTLQVVASSSTRVGAAYSALLANATDTRAFARTGSSGLAVWNLDPSSGAVAAELSWTTALTAVAGALGTLLSGIDGQGVMVTSATTDSIYALDSSGAVNTRSGLVQGASSSRMALAARSVDGRRLWTTAAISAPAAPDTVSLISMAGVLRMALVIGDGQSALPGEVLPQPVRIQVTDEEGRPMAGALVRFELADSSQGTLVGTAGPLMAERTTDLRGESEVEWRMPAQPALAAAAAAPGLHSRSATLLAISPCAEGRAASLALASTGTLAMRITVPGAPCALVPSALVQVTDSDAAPVALAVGPEDGATGVYTATRMFVRFNQHMDPNSLSQSVRLSADGNPVPFHVELGEQNRVLWVAPEQPLPFGSNAEMVLAQGARDQEGQALSRAAVTRFTVEGEPALSLRSLSPPAGAAGTRVVISGRGFAGTTGDNVVLLNGVRSTVSVASDRALVVTVPGGVASGDVTVQVGLTVSNALPYRVLERNQQPGGLAGDVPGTPGSRDLAVTPDGGRVYVTNPRTNSVSVLAMTTLGTEALVPVGLEPEGIAILVDPTRAYVANAGSNNVSVIDAGTSSPSYNQIVATIGVGRRPVDVAVSPLGPRVLVVCAEDSTVSLIDANPGSGSFDHVTKTVVLPSSGTQVAVLPDGGRAYVASAAGVEVLDLRLDVVTKTIPIKSGSTSVAVVPDGTILFALRGDGILAVIDLTPGSSTYETVTKTVPIGTGSTTVAVTADGGLLYVTSRDGNIVYVYSIDRGSGSVVVPNGTGGAGTTVAVAPVDTIGVGASPSALTMAPDGALAMVANEGSGSISLLDTGANEAALVGRMVARFDRYRLSALGAWSEGLLELPAPYGAASIQRGRLRLQRLIPADTSGAAEVGDQDGNNVSDLKARFRRAVLPSVLAEGESVVVVVTGDVLGVAGAPQRAFVARDTVRVRRGVILDPIPGHTVSPGTYRVRYTVRSPGALWAALLNSHDSGASWTLVADHRPNTGVMDWPTGPPNDSVRVAVVEVEAENADGTVTGVLAESGDLLVAAVSDVVAAPVILELDPVQPNPSRSEVSLRYGMPRPGDARLEVFDIAGRRVARLAQGHHDAGWHVVRWRGTSTAGGALGSGVYFVRLVADRQTLERRMVWIH